MNEYLNNFLKQFEEISELELPLIAQCIPVVELSKGTIIQSEKKIPEACYYVLKGIVRQFHDQDGVEVTTNFYTKNNGAISSTDYLEETPSKFNLVCVEDCVLIRGDKQIDVSNFQKFPVLQKITAKMVEADLNKLKEQFIQFTNASPKDRYLNFLAKEPDLIQRVPLHQIASYLGMTAESLSRIRKRLANEGN